MDERSLTHLVISLKMLYVDLVSKQTNILIKIMVINIAIKKFKEQPSINLTFLSIFQKYYQQGKFSFLTNRM